MTDFLMSLYEDNYEYFMDILIRKSVMRIHENFVSEILKFW